MPSSSTNKRKRTVVTARRGPSTGMITGIVVVLLFAAAVAFGVIRAGDKATEIAVASVPPHALAAGVPIGQPKAPVTVDVYLDYQCPVCRLYEQQVGPTLDSLAGSGSIRVIYHPLAFLDTAASDKYSTRASSAAGCAAEHRVFPQFTKLLFENQPPEGGTGLSDGRLTELGRQAGAPDGFGACVAGRNYASWTAGLTEQASKDGVTAPPTVLVHGKKIDNTSDALVQAVEAAAH